VRTANVLLPVVLALVAAVATILLALTLSAAQAIRTLVARINSSLIEAERPGPSNGTAQIPANVRAVNRLLVSARADAGNILAGLLDIAGHLRSICAAAVLNSAVAGLTGLADPTAPCR
jgi:Skp family chaperone for outer membrane proteins